MITFLSAPDVYVPPADEPPSVLWIVFWSIAGALWAALLFVLAQNSPSAAIGLAALGVIAALAVSMNSLTLNLTEEQKQQELQDSYFSSVSVWITDTYGLDVTPAVAQQMITQDSPATVVTDGQALSVRIIPTAAGTLSLVDDSGTEIPAKG